MSQPSVVLGDERLLHLPHARIVRPVLELEADRDRDRAGTASAAAAISPRYAATPIGGPSSSPSQRVPR